MIGHRRVPEIQDGGQINGSANICVSMTYQNSNGHLRYSTMANSQEAYLGVSKDDRQFKMAAETGNTYVSETMKGTVEIPTTSVGFKTL